MKKYLKPVLYTLLAILAVIQFIRPAKNLSADLTYDVATKYPVPNEVLEILKPACFDCHSNFTRYPWYAEIQPVAWWLNDHVVEGKKNLNFNNFTSRRIAIQNHKFEEIVEVVKENEMPLGSYTLVHRDAILSEQQKQTLLKWAQAMQDTLKMNYPADSLVLRRKR